VTGDAPPPFGGREGVLNSGGWGSGLFLDSGDGVLDSEGREGGVLGSEVGDACGIWSVGDPPG